MIAHLKLDDRLSILRAGDPLRSWNSLDDQRICVVCGRKFKGRQVDMCPLAWEKIETLLSHSGMHIDAASVDVPSAVGHPRG